MKKHSDPPLRHLLTPWGEELSQHPDTIPLSEYPRPSLVRQEWQCLNGYWEYAIRKGGEQWPREGADGRIRVPFSPECVLSGVGRQLLPGEILWYRRTFSWKPSEGKPQVLLHIGAADQEARVWINGQYAGEHIGGYLPFTLEVADLLQEGANEILIAVRDDSDTSWHARGKQKLLRGGMFYTATSGIWQSVWLENVPAAYIRSIETRNIAETRNTAETQNIAKTRNIAAAERDSGSNGAGQAKVSGAQIQIRVNTAYNEGGLRVRLQIREAVLQNGEYLRKPGDVLQLRGRQLCEIEIPTDAWYTVDVPGEPSLWSQEMPWLYGITAAVGMDEADSYFALRRFSSVPLEQLKNAENNAACARAGSRKGDHAAAGGLRGLALNGQLQHQRGVLDQGYWSDGMYTAPSDEALICDIVRMKQLGFNMLRKHIKLEPERWYYHCDRLGMAVWQDMVCGGGAFRAWFVTYGATLLQQLGVRIRDSHTYLLGRSGETGRQEFEREMLETAELLHSHPCLCTWVIFNEGWGQFETRRLTGQLREADPEHLIDSASGWFDQGCGDFQSIHHYYLRLVFDKKDTRIRALSEFGGLPLGIKGHMACVKSYGYGRVKDLAELNRSFWSMLQRADGLLKDGFCAWIYTQVSDVEEEINGILTFDRRVQKIHGRQPEDSAGAERIPLPGSGL